MPQAHDASKGTGKSYRSIAGGGVLSRDRSLKPGPGIASASLSSGRYQHPLALDLRYPACSAAAAVAKEIRFAADSLRAALHPAR